MNHQIKAHLVNADRFAKLALEGDIAVLCLSKREIDAGLVGDAVDRLMVLTDRLEVIERYTDSLAICFDGFDDDPREVYEIPEVVRFFRAVDAQWGGFWLHFVEKSSFTMSLLIRLLCDVKVQRKNGKMVGFSFERPEQFQQELLRLFGSMNALYGRCNFGEARNRLMTKRVMAAVNRMADGGA